jgi:hypothetical protein
MDPTFIIVVIAVSVVEVAVPRGAADHPSRRHVSRAGESTSDDGALCEGRAPLFTRPCPER